MVTIYKNIIASMFVGSKLESYSPYLVYRSNAKQQTEIPESYILIFLFDLIIIYFWLH